MRQPPIFGCGSLSRWSYCSPDASARFTIRLSHMNPNTAMLTATRLTFQAA
jgi:hypothetical protein